MREDSAMDRKKRSKNFSNRDRFLLTDVMKTEVKVIESKRHDGRSNDARKQAWKNVVNAFNARTDEKREEKQLAQLWRDIKRNAKKDHSRFRRQRMGTGGGPEPAPLESLTEEIRDMIPQVFQPIVGVVDDDEEMEIPESGDCFFFSTTVKPRFTLFLLTVSVTLNSSQ